MGRTMRGIIVVSVLLLLWVRGHQSSCVILAKPRCYRQLSIAHEETEAQRGAVTGLRSHSQEVVELGLKPRLYHSTQYAHLDVHVPARTHKHVWHKAHVHT